MAASSCCATPGKPSKKACSKCEAEICENCKTVINGFPVCQECADEFTELKKKEAGGVLHLLPAIALGLITAVVCAIIWAMIAIGADYEIGFVAIGLGWLTGTAIHYGAGRKRSTLFQIAACVFAVLGLVLAKIIIFIHAILTIAKVEPSISHFFNLELIKMAIENLQHALGPFDALWAILAISAAWRACAPTEVEVKPARRSRRRTSSAED